MDEGTTPPNTIFSCQIAWMATDALGLLTAPGGPSYFKLISLKHCLPNSGLIVENVNPVITPLAAGVNLDDHPEIKNFTQHGEAHAKATHGYATLIGSLMYFAMGTQPDIAYAMNKFAQFTSNPLPKQVLDRRQLEARLALGYSRQSAYSRSTLLLYHIVGSKHQVALVWVWFQLC